MRIYIPLFLLAAVIVLSGFFIALNQQNNQTEEFYIAATWLIKPTRKSAASISAYGSSYLLIHAQKSHDEHYTISGEIIYYGSDWTCTHPHYDCEYVHEFNGSFIGTATLINNELVLYPLYAEDTATARPHEQIQFLENGTVVDSTTLYQLELSLAEAGFLHTNGFRIPYDEDLVIQKNASTSETTDPVYYYNEHVSAGYVQGNFYLYDSPPEQSSVTPSELLQNLK